MMGGTEDGACVQLRRARLDEAAAVAHLWFASRRASVPQVPPPAHDEHEVRNWFHDAVFPSRDVWVAEEACGSLAALMVLGGEWIEQLYVHPAWSGRGIGSQLIERAKQACSSLDLWTFQSNPRARRFYERHGFVAVATTDGENEEGAPDVRYHWQRRWHDPEAVRP